MSSFGAEGGDRTHDLRFTIPPLYQLSYFGKTFFILYFFKTLVNSVPLPPLFQISTDTQTDQINKIMLVFINSMSGKYQNFIITVFQVLKYQPVSM